MEAYSSSSNSSGSSPMYLPSHQYSKDLNKSLKMPQSFQSSLHSVRKSNVKPWKKPIAPLPPTPPKVYKVDPINFKGLVQQLTGAPEFAAAQSQQQQMRLHSLAPPPLELAGPTSTVSTGALFGRDDIRAAATPLQHLPSPAKTFSAFYQELMSETMAQKPSSMMTSTSLELNLSPSSRSWCAFPLLSPGTLSSLEQSTVL